MLHVYFMSGVMIVCESGNVCCIFCIDLSMDRFVLCVTCLTVFVNCLVKQFGIFLVMVVSLMCEDVLCWIDHVCVF